MRRLISGMFILLAVVFAQAQDTINNPLNTAEKMLLENTKLTIGGYAQIDYNQAFGEDFKQNGHADVHRWVMMMGYKFNKHTSFISEVEYEHVKEVFVEQAFLNYKISKYIDFRGGLLLIPMGIMNEYHEPTTFNGVERPSLDSKIVPTTWREIGAGLTGNILEHSFKYQLYVVNGFLGYDGSARLNGANGLRGGRQKGAESIMSYPNFSGKIEYYGIAGLNIGLSGYFGKSQTELFDGNTPSATADSSVVGISVIGADFRYNFKGLQLRGQYNYIGISNTQQYNNFASSDVGSAISGFYAEIGYNVFRPLKYKTELTPFVRYENFDTHYSVISGTIKNEAYNRTEITAGLGWKPHNGVVLKADVQFLSNKASDDWSKVMNLGIGISF